MIYLLLVLILLINCYLLNYDFYPLVVSTIIYNIVLYLNFIVFLVSIFEQKKKYGVEKNNMVLAIFLPIFFLILNYFIRKTTFLAKPFSDFFGYLIIKKKLNKTLNTLKKDISSIKLIIEFIGDIFTSGKSIPEYFYESKSPDYDYNWYTFINSIPFNPNGINKNVINNINKRPVLKTILEVERNPNIQYGGKKLTILERIFDLLIDFYVVKDTYHIDEILRQSKLNVNSSIIIDLLDRKFLVSKIIWLILIIFTTQAFYSILIIRKE